MKDYDSMVSLVEDMDAVPNLRVTDTVAIQHLYAFALNRRRLPGDSDKALVVLHKVNIVYCSFSVSILLSTSLFCIS